MNTADWMVWRMSNLARAGDVIVVGVATPLALCAAMLARATTPDVRVVVGGAVDPEPHDIAETVHDPGSLPARSSGVIGQEALLAHVQRGSFTLQFVSPAQVDGSGQMNTVRVGPPDRSKWLAGPLAIPDISGCVGRLVAYRAEHSPRVLVEVVDYVNGSATVVGIAGWRDRYHLPGAGVTAVVTSLAEMVWSGDGFAVTALGPQASSLEAVREQCGFALQDSLETSPPPRALDLLEAIDPSRVRDLEVGVPG